jgi:hypothetical protein
VPVSTVAIAVAILSIALLAGCGSDESGQAAEGTNSVGTVEHVSLGKAAFIKRADALCAASERRAKSAYFVALETHVHAGKETKAEHDAHDLALLKVVLSKELRRQVSEIRALARRAGKEAEVRAFLVAMETAIGEAASEPQTMIRLGGPGFARPDKLAREYGFAVCGRSK